jgi:predicted dehydrogenase
MSKVRVGVIGAGGIAQVAHIPSYQKLENVTVAAICDPNAAKLEFVKGKFGIPEAFSDFRRLLDMPDIDAVSVCTPNHLHAPIAIAALQAGKHVICEKPICASGKAAEAIVAAAASANKTFMGAFVSRFSSNSQYLKGLINEGHFGEVYYCKAGFIRRRGVPGLGGWFTSKACDGGCMADIGVHALDRMFWLMGSPEPVSVAGKVTQKFGANPIDGGWPPYESRVGDVYDGVNDVDDMAQGYVRFADGRTLFVESSWASNGPGSSNMWVYGTDCGATETDEGLKLYAEVAKQDVDLKPRVPELEDGYTAELRHFVDCFTNGKPPITTPAEIVAVARIIEAIYKSSELGREVLISEL